MIDVINLINIIKIGYLSRKFYVKAHLKEQNVRFIKFLYKQGLIKKYMVKDGSLLIFLRYVNNEPLFKNFVFISKKGYRRYITLKELKKLNQVSGTNTLILSTSVGYLTNVEAFRLKIGGELLYKIMY